MGGYDEYEITLLCPKCEVENNCTIGDSYDYDDNTEYHSYSFIVNNQNNTNKCYNCEYEFSEKEVITELKET